MSRYLGNALRAEIFADTWEWEKGDHWLVLGLVLLSGGWILLVSWHWVSFLNAVDNCEGWLIFSGSFPNALRMPQNIKAGTDFGTCACGN